MKMVKIGKEEGYLITKKEVDDKLKEKFEALEGMRIRHIWDNDVCYVITYSPVPKIEYRDDYFFIDAKQVEEDEDKNHNHLYIRKELLMKLLGFKENLKLRYVSLMRVKNSKAYYISTWLDFETYFNVGKEIFYFFKSGEEESEDIFPLLET